MALGGFCRLCWNPGAHGKTLRPRSSWWEHDLPRNSPVPQGLPGQLAPEPAELRGGQERGSVFTHAKSARVVTATPRAVPLARAASFQALSSLKPVSALGNPACCVLFVSLSSASPPHVCLSACTSPAWHPQPPFPQTPDGKNGLSGLHTSCS